MFRRCCLAVIAGALAVAAMAAADPEFRERRPAPVRSMNLSYLSNPSYPTGSVPQSTWNGVFTEVQASEGAALYRSHCASCHGDALGGGEAVPALVGVTFSATWEGVPLFDLYDRVRTTMPPGKTGVLARSGYASLVAYLLKSNGMPAGEKTLGADKASLMGLVYRTNRP